MKIVKSAMLGAAALAMTCMPVIAAAKEATPAAPKLSVMGKVSRAGAKVDQGSHASGGGFKWFWIAAVVAGITAATIIATRDPKPKSP